MRANQRPRFEDLTETTGIPLSEEAADMMYTRYAWGARLAAGKRVLELGCGAGQGLGMLSGAATFVIGGDYSRPLLAGARRHYRARVPLVQLSADELPFANASFDVILFFEGSYYVRDMARGFRDIARVLRPGGSVAFVNANPDRPDFIVSPLSVHYHTGDEFTTMLAQLGFRVSVEGAFPVSPQAHGGRNGGRALTRVLSLARRALGALGLVPKTLRGRARLKRLVYGKLIEVPAEIREGFASVAPRAPIGPGQVTGFKVIYVLGHKPAGPSEPA